MWECKYHVILVPKYRNRANYGKLRREIGPLLRELLRQNGAEVVADSRGAYYVEAVRVGLLMPLLFSATRSSNNPGSSVWWIWGGGAFFLAWLLTAFEAGRGD